MPQRLEQPQAARLLLHDKARRVLKPFLLRPCTIPEAAQAANLPANVTAYWVKKMLALHLLECGQCGQAGTVKVYQASDTAFFAPFAALGARTTEALYRELTAPFESVFARSISVFMTDTRADWGICLSVHDDTLVVTVVDESTNTTLNTRRPDAPATLNLWGSLNLDFAEAKALQNELIEVYQRYLNKTGGQRYGLRLGMVPLGTTAE